MNENIMRDLGFGEHVELVHQGLCPFCKKPIGKFRDELSHREYGISGLCQACQDETFKEVEE